LKRVWMKSWLYASAMAASLALAGAAAGAPQEPAPKSHVANELTLAGLRPGKDTFAAAEKRYKSKLLRARAKSVEGKAKPEEGKDKSADNGKDKADEIKEWLDDCHGRSLKLGLDAKGTILSVTISAIAPTDGDCKDKRADFLNWRNWMTGRGLRLGDPRDRVIEIYGEPDSDGPSVKGTRELELLYYAFDWAGSDVPQVLEVSCERSTGKVLEITLAFPSL
jgi:hypothetical protein